MCEHGCLYCYARWYRFQDPKLTKQHIEEFLQYVKYISKTRPNKIIPFRISTLVDPLQRNERCIRNCQFFPEICLRRDIPLLLNTKSDLVLKENILDLLIRLSERKLVVVQISISFLSEKIWRILEPNTPPPSKRLEVIEVLARQHEVPVVIRIQPVIPRVTDLELNDLIRAAAEAGARHVVIESLRLDYQTLRVVSSKLPEVLEVNWSPYTSATPGLLWPDKSWRRRVAELARELCDTFNLLFATCKEGFLDLWTAPDCCGIYLLTERAGLRITIRELVKYQGSVPRDTESIISLAESLDKRYLDRTDIYALPRPIRKKILHHYKILLSVIKSGKYKDMLGKLTSKTQ